MGNKLIGEEFMMNVTVHQSIHIKFYINGN